MGTLGAFACIAFLVACGGGEGESHRAKRAINDADQARAESIVLRLSDFPSGWRAESSEGDGSDKCRKLSFSDLTLTGDADSDEFVEGDTTRAFSTAAIFQTTQQADRAFRRVSSDEFEKCLGDAVKKGVASGDANVTDISYGRLSFPKLGDRSGAYQVVIELEADGLTPTVYVDAVVVLRARAISILAFADVFSPFDEETKESLARIIAQRMEEGE